jgi:rhodanese-related sulfurtransferase
MFGTDETCQEKSEHERQRMMKRIILLCGMLAAILVAALIFTSCVRVNAPTSTNSTYGYEDVTVDEAQQLIGENSNLIILDVRTQSEFDSGHIVNAILIPVGELADRLGELDETKTILVYCQKGVRSAQASEVLIDGGFCQVFNLEGGIIAWEEVGAEINYPPVIESFTSDEIEAAPSTACHIECIASDSNGDELRYEWSSEGGDISGTGSTVIWTASEVLGVHNITVVVTDGLGGESSSSVSINVGVNHPPVIEELIITPEAERDFNPAKMKLYKGKSCDIQCIASDPDGDELSYQWSADVPPAVRDYWSAVGSISGEGSSVTWTAPSTLSEVAVTVTASDGRGGSDTYSVVFQVATCYCSLDK